MRQFTTAEKELIVNTPITIDCFDLELLQPKESFTKFLDFAEATRKASLKEYKTKTGDKYFSLLVAILPNSYKVVKL